MAIKTQNSAIGGYHPDLQRFLKHPTQITWHIAQTCLVHNKPLYTLVPPFAGTHPEVETIKRIMNYKPSKL